MNNLSPDINKCDPLVREYQKLFVDHIRNVIERNYFFTKPNICVLDAGCDPTGIQLCHISNLVKGEVIGTNIGDNFPAKEALKRIRTYPKVSMQKMDATELQFDDETFDMVVSANVMEHVNNPILYLKECSRVLKTGGVAYFETYPVWSSARGHHVMEEMVDKVCPSKCEYRNDGSFIPDWSHLFLNPTQMMELLQDKLDEEAIHFIINYIYESDDINRQGWNSILKAFKQTFEQISVETIAQVNSHPKYKPQGFDNDYDVAGFRAVCWKKRARLRFVLCSLFYHIRRRMRLIWKYKIQRL